MIRFRIRTEKTGGLNAYAFPCPFCPGKDDDLELRDENPMSYIFCQCCGARGPVGGSRQNAIEAWNVQNEYGWDERLLAIEGKRVTVKGEE